MPLTVGNKSLQEVLNQDEIVIVYRDEMLVFNVEVTESLPWYHDEKAGYFEIGCSKATYPVVEVDEELTFFDAVAAIMPLLDFQNPVHLVIHGELRRIQSFVIK